MFCRTLFKECLNQVLQDIEAQSGGDSAKNLS